MPQIATLSQIKKELEHLSEPELVKLCLSLAKFSKDNKEYLHFQIFDAQDKTLFLENCKSELQQKWMEANLRNYYLAKKSIRKIIKLNKKYIKFSADKELEIELLIFFCQQMSEALPYFNDYSILENIYKSQLKGIEKAVATLHEDLQYDYQQRVEELKNR